MRVRASVTSEEALRSVVEMESLRRSTSGEVTLERLGGVLVLARAVTQVGGAVMDAGPHVRGGPTLPVEGLELGHEAVGHRADVGALLAQLGGPLPHGGGVAVHGITP